MKISSNLKYLKRVNGITRYQLAKDLEVNESLLRKIENGVSRNPRIATIIKICTFFRVSLDEFVYKDLDK